ncbi:MAG: family 16 glycosylhydrolase [Bacteroidetes bacterium]|nr:family 16 glycosylhydrolase [Bacteroidota bacterium]
MMKFILIFILLSNTVLSQSTFFTGGNICPSDDWHLVFSDEFNDTTLNKDIWFTYYPCNDNWSVPCEGARVSNNNLWLENNVVESNGTLKLIARKETATWFSTTRDFTSGLIFSNGSYRFPYGKFEMYGKVPSGAGLNAAFWLFGGDGAGNSTEIDVFEFRGDKPKIYHPGIFKYEGADFKAHHDCKIESIDFSLDYHLYVVEWDPFLITFYIDNSPVFIISRFYTLSGNEVTWCCVEPGIYTIQPAYPHGLNTVLSIIAGLGVGSGDDAPNANTSFPSQFEIDYIRVYQRDPPSSADYNCEVLLFPNPVTSSLKIRKNRMTRVRIENIFGEILFSKTVTGDETDADVSFFRQGIYFVEVQSEDGTFANKFIKQ